MKWSLRAPAVDFGLDFARVLADEGRDALLKLTEPLQPV